MNQPFKLWNIAEGRWHDEKNDYPILYSSNARLIQLKLGDHIPIQDQIIDITNEYEKYDCTGLPDNYGVLIYEGDIVKFYNPFTKQFLIRVIGWDKECCHFYAWDIKRKDNEGYLNGSLGHLSWWVNNHSDETKKHGIEIIGHIKTDAHLLK